MKRLIPIAICIFLSQISSGQVMMLFSSDSLTNITSPLDLDSLFYWFAADVGVTDSLGGAIANNEGVGTWNDLSGNGYHVTQTTNGSRPVYKATGGPGSKPTIQFDGSNDFLASSAHWWGSDDLTVFVVMKFGNVTRDAFESVVTKFNGPSNQRQWAFPDGASSADSYHVSLKSSSAGTAATLNTLKITSTYTKFTNYRLIAVVSNGTTGQTFSDGVSQTPSGTVTTIYDSSVKLGIGAANTDSTPASFLQGSISEIIVFSRALTTTERQAIETYLNRKYDLY